MPQPKRKKRKRRIKLKGRVGVNKRKQVNADILKTVPTTIPSNGPTFRVKIKRK